jgi:anaphase-promoting complex subunit 7
VLQARKQQLKARQMRSPEPAAGDQPLLTGEVEVKFRLHQCYVALGQPNQAVNVLQSIVAKQRTPKVSMALGKLYQQIGMERPAAAAYREVVRECPLALEAVRALLQLGAKPREVQELGLEGRPALLASRQADWLAGWAAGQAALHARDYDTAVAELRRLEEGEAGGLVMRGCVGLLVDQGLAHQWAGRAEEAVAVLGRAAALDRQLVRGMDGLAALLAGLGRTRELETLATRLMAVSEEAPQPWVAMGHFCHLNKKSPRAVYFAHKACLLDTRNVEALLLKGNVLLDLKKLPDAMNHFREALQIAGHRFEAHKVRRPGRATGCSIQSRHQRCHWRPNFGIPPETS